MSRINDCHLPPEQGEKTKVNGSRSRQLPQQTLTVPRSLAKGEATNTCPTDPVCSNIETDN
jgi:hypothetical protein